MVTVTPRRARTFPEVLVGDTPMAAISGAKSSPENAPAMADERVAIKVSPICTAAKKSSMFRCRKIAVDAPGRFSFSNLFSLARGTEISAISRQANKLFKRISSPITHTKTGKDPIATSRGKACSYSDYQVSGGILRLRTLHRHGEDINHNRLVHRT